MKLATIDYQGSTRAAVVEGNHPTKLLSPDYRDVLAVVTAASGGEKDMLANSESLSSEHPLLLAPIPRPRRNIFCVGKNYREHAREFAGSGFDSGASTDIEPEAPIIFSKVPESVIGPNDPIRYDATASQAVDYEGELAVIIGKGGRKIHREQAMTQVWGYTIINDITARDVQKRLKQWLVGKSFDTFCPMGPWAVTADEIDLSDATLRTWVNGELRQQANTRDLIFDVATIIETISSGVTLYPGDMIATGTPVGVGVGFDPPKLLKNGDSVTVEIPGIGQLTNPVQEMSEALSDGDTFGANT